MVRVLKNIFNIFLSYFKSFCDYFPLSRLIDGSYKIRENIRYCCQFASPELVKDILEKKILARDDPRWEEFGFLTQEEYEFWCWRACGIACIKMVIETVSIVEIKINNLVKKVLDLGGYIIYNKNGQFVDKGWYYKPLINLAKEYNLKGKSFSYLTVQNICVEILKNHFVIASVDPNIIRYDKKEFTDKKGGHLVLIFGFKWKNKGCVGFYLHNSSGKRQETRENVFMPMEIFKRAFANKGFSIWK